VSPRHCQHRFRPTVRLVLLPLVLGGSVAGAAPGPDAGFEAALCSGLVDEIERTFTEQHIDRAVEPLEIGSGDVSAVDRFACVSSSLGVAAFAHVTPASPTDPPHGATFVWYTVPPAIDPATTRVGFNVSRCVWRSSFWGHPGHVDFHNHDGRWTHDVTVVTDFLDGFCGDEQP